MIVPIYQIHNDEIKDLIGNGYAYGVLVGDLCDISKEITFDMTRHTFATSVTLINGVLIETVSKMLGHKNLHTTQHYAKVLDRKVSEDMKLLKNKLLCDNKQTIPRSSNSI